MGHLISPAIISTTGRAAVLGLWPGRPSSGVTQPTDLVPIIFEGENLSVRTDLAALLTRIYKMAIAIGIEVDSTQVAVQVLGLLGPPLPTTGSGTAG